MSIGRGGELGAKPLAQPYGYMIELGADLGDSPRLGPLFQPASSERPDPMPMTVIKGEVAMMLRQASQQIAEAEAKLASGTYGEKVHAAGELAFLKRQKETLDLRLEEIENHPEASETLFQWIKEEWFNLTLRLDNWIATV
jgi:hypothetical protein